MVAPQLSPPRAPAAAPPLLATARDGGSPWWWNGSTWMHALTPDRLWRWDGTGWKLTLELPSDDPAACAAALDTRAEELFAEAGEILVWRWPEWSFPEALRGAITSAHQALTDAAAAEARAAELARSPAGGLTSLLNRLSGTDDERRSREVEREELRERAAAQCAELGRQASRPSIKEADDVLDAAANLRARARELSSATASLVAARAEHDERVRAAAEKVTAAESAQAEAIAVTERAVDEASERHRQRVARARDRLHLLTRPGAGERFESFGGCHLHRHVILTPDGRGPVAGAVATLGTPAELWAGHEAVIRSLLAIDSVGAMALDDALTVATPELFLLVTTSLAATVVHCHGRDEERATAFARAVNQAAAAAAERIDADEKAVTAARSALEQVLADSGEIEAARAESHRAGSDPHLAKRLRTARERMAAVSADTGPRDAAAVGVESIIQSITSPPAPLTATSPA